MSATVVMGAGFDNDEPAFPVATDWECVINKAAKEAVFETWIESDDFNYWSIVIQCT